MNKNLSTVPKPHRPLRRLLFALLCIFLVVGWYGGIGFTVAHARGLEDWAVLQNYTAPADVAAIASQDTMTAAARRIFYVNAPALQTGSTFTASCKNVPRAEQSIVLGCYQGNQAGIFVLKVSDARLQGVEQVTSAHEMLHAAYDRLSGREKTRVNGLLENYYQNDLQDASIKATVDAYKQSEPNDVVNEMHSIFGTEVVHLSPALETYYSQYFTDRSKVTNFAAAYQAEFTNRKNQVAAYDAQLASLKQQIEADNADLAARDQELTAQEQTLHSWRDSNPAAYNAAIPAYNAKIAAYNSELAVTRQLIAQYNGIVAARNAIALEEQQLVGELSGKDVPAASQ